ncbi:MAG TPA: VCBS repeat-containing protein, partial [Gammaproteobacteria bacterium]|nr:VCBS repeat-containing protein [Gammaproteobacteria bacterium]
DFDRLKLLPYQQSDRGPGMAVGDINNDGLEDIFLGGSKYIPSRIFAQSKSGFLPLEIPTLKNDSVAEAVDAVIEDFNRDGKADLFVGTGGADFYGQARPLLDRFYASGDSGFIRMEIPMYFENASCVKPFDFDNDGDQDLFIGSESVSDDFGSAPKSYLLTNDNGQFTPTQIDLFEKLGMVTDAVWQDYDNDGQVDLTVVGEWMAPVFLKNSNGVFSKEKIVQENLNGLWQSISSFDIDKDGDPDYILGNWGLNSKFRASEKFPLRMYYNDFDKNGKTETIVAIEKKEKYYPLVGFDVLVSQIPSLRKKYTSYHASAGKTIDEIFSDQALNESIRHDVHELASGYLQNDKGKFKFISFPIELQIAPIMAQLKYDFDLDTHEEVLLGGNYFGVQPVHGRYGSFSGALIKNNNEILPGYSIGLDLINQSVRNFKVITIKNEKYLLVAINDGRAQIYKLNK